MTSNLTNLAKDMEFSPEEIQHILDNLDSFSTEELDEIDKIVGELSTREANKSAHDDLIEFCIRMQPDYKVGRHHRILANMLMAIERGDKDRVCVNIPPRHGKSQLVSIFYPAWFLGRNPDKKVMMVSHTTDLAVDFGRKVRNLIASADFKTIFPKVSLAADSKSAGRWSTNSGGEYFACILPDTPIVTHRGVLPAADVVSGDMVLSHSGFVPVHSMMHTSHEETVFVAGAGYSVEHPVWTMNRGWVEAGSISPTDVLTSVNILDILKVLLWGAYNGIMELAHVSALVQHKEQVHEPEQREIPKLRWAWDHVRCAVGGIRSVLCGHGRPTVADAHSGANRQQWALQSRELPLGERRAATEQQAHVREDRGSYLGATCATVGVDPRGAAVSDISRTRCVESNEETQSQHEGASDPINLGWLRRCAARVLNRCGQHISGRAQSCCPQEYLARLPEAAQKLFGVLLGVRYAGRIARRSHESREFVNFRVGGDNTFFSAGVLTHNCGIGSALAGRGADLLLVDDPHSEQDVINGNFSVFEKAYEWFTFGARTRLMPGGRVAIVQCMTGDTPVLMADGYEKPLKDVTVGDEVASYNSGRLVTRKVLNWQLSGLDEVFAIKTACGKIVRANKRHPFLVLTPEGTTVWTRLKHLKPGDFLVSLKDAVAPRAQKLNEPLSPLPITSDFTVSKIESITASGSKEVFDIQVEGTENFIANGLVSHNTRWHMDDLTGRVTDDMVKNEKADQYEIVEFPAILDVEDADGKPAKKPLWPEFFDLAALERTKASMPAFQWNSQYQQQPTAEEASIVKREWWNLWPHDQPPPVEYIIMSLDAAAEKHNRADFTALTTWGVFFNEEQNNHHIILLNSIKERLEFPELKQLSMDEYGKWGPDAFIVEKKSAGTAIYQEMRRMGLPVQEYTPHRGTGDKLARLNSVADIIASGMVWVPTTRWADELVEEVAGFPFMSNDDLVDSTVMALLRFRQGGFIRLPTDEWDDEPTYRPKREYY